MVDVFFVANRNQRVAGAIDFGDQQPNDRPRAGRMSVAIDDNNRLVQTFVDGTLSNGILYPENNAPAAQIIGLSALLDDLQQTAAQAHADVVLYVHGFETDFTSSIFFAAQYAYNLAKRRAELVSANPGLDRALGRPPLVLVFSWPSIGRVIGGPRLNAYMTDRIQGQRSGPALATLLMEFKSFNDRRFAAQIQQATGTAFEAATSAALLGAMPTVASTVWSFHLVTQSMGNWVFRWAVQALRDPADFGLELQRIFGQIFLCGADVDTDSLDSSDKLGLVTMLAKNVTLYRDTRDGALELSEKFENGEPRLGREGPDRPPESARVSLVDVTMSIDWDMDPLGHYYNRINPWVHEDMLRLMSGAPPDTGPLRQAAFNSPRYYRLYNDQIAALARYEEWIATHA